MEWRCLKCGGLIEADDAGHLALLGRFHIIEHERLAVKEFVARAYLHGRTEAELEAEDDARFLQEMGIRWQ